MRFEREKEKLFVAILISSLVLSKLKESSSANIEEGGTHLFTFETLFPFLVKNQ